MERLLSQETFDRLFPFSCVVDSAGQIVQIGRSLRKVSPSTVEGLGYREAFRLEQPSFGISSFEPASLVDEFVRLSLVQRAGFLLCGQVVRMGAGDPLFIFSLGPDISRISSLEEFGLDFSDFALAEPLVDRMIFSSLFRQARASVQELQERLAWRDTGTKLLHTLAAELFGLDDERDVYRVTLEHVCEILRWEMGHVFVASDGGSTMVSAGISRVWKNGKYAALLERSQEIAFGPGEGLFDGAAEEREVMWIQDVTKDASFRRRDAVTSFERLTLLVVPINCGGKTVAVLEFFTERVFSNFERAPQIFDLIRRIVEQQVARVALIRSEREHQAALLSASKMATLGELAAGIGHEINNPVSAISISAELLRRMASTGPVDPEALSAQVLRIQKCITHITTIVGDMQSFSRDPSRDPILEHRVADLVSGALTLCGAKFAGKRVALKVSPIGADWRASCRAAQVSQVILNLLSNAFDAVAENDNAWVRLDVADEGESFAITVTDSGLGVPEAIREKIMSPFFTTKPPGKGTGLGLGISRSIMQSLGGDLFYKAEAPNTTFIARLPKVCRAG